MDVPSTNSGPLKEEELVMGKLLHRWKSNYIQRRLFYNFASLRLRLVQDMNAHPVWGVEPDPRDCSRVATHNIGEICHFIGTVNRLHRSTYFDWPSLYSVPKRKNVTANQSYWLMKFIVY